MKIPAAVLSDGATVNIDGRVARVVGEPTATKYGLVKISLTGGRIVLANQDEPITLV